MNAKQGNCVDRSLATLSHEIKLLFNIYSMANVLRPFILCLCLLSVDEDGTLTSTCVFPFYTGQ